MCGQWSMCDIQPKTFSFTVLPKNYMAAVQQRERYITAPTWKCSFHLTLKSWIFNNFTAPMWAFCVTCEAILTDILLKNCNLESHFSKCVEYSIIVVRLILIILQTSAFISVCHQRVFMGLKCLFLCLALCVGILTCQLIFRSIHKTLSKVTVGFIMSAHLLVSVLFLQKCFSGTHLNTLLLE